MERPLNLLRGCVRVEAAGAMPEGMLNRMAKAGISFWGAEPVDACTLRFTVLAADYEKLPAIAGRCGCSLKPLRRRGAPVVGKRLFHRKVLAACLIFLAAVLAFSSLFVWEIDIEGNNELSKGEIRRALADCGVDVGAFWPSFSNELIRNEMIIKLPELRWLAVNISHSRAEVIVRERTPKPEIVDNDSPVNVMARTTGIITKMDVWQGRPLFKVGDAVIAGEIIVAGTMDSSFTGAGERYVHAIADIEASTWYEMTSSAPLVVRQKDYTGDTDSRWALMFGNKRINFYLGSRNSVGDCDKLSHTYPFSMEGVFTLPLSLVHESYEEYELVETERSREEVLAELEQAMLWELDDRLAGQGEVVSYTVSSTEKDGYIIATLRAECSENIAVSEPFIPAPVNEGENLTDDRDKSSD